MIQLPVCTYINNIRHWNKYRKQSGSKRDLYRKPGTPHSHPHRPSPSPPPPSRPLILPLSSSTPIPSPLPTLSPDRHAVGPEHTPACLNPKLNFNPNLPIHANAETGAPIRTVGAEAPEGEGGPAPLGGLGGPTGSVSIKRRVKKRSASHRQRKVPL
jgi:hypothetical protein